MCAQSAEARRGRKKRATRGERSAGCVANAEGEENERVEKREVDYGHVGNLLKT
jgi:hypothetical protein